jgi:hypothetical protein
MVNQVQTIPDKARISLGVCCVALAGLALFAANAVEAQGNTAFFAKDSHSSKERPLPDRLPDKPTFPPSFSVPIEPLGFSPPGVNYLGQRNALVSLDFLDENRLLFTFRVPGLIHRDSADRTWKDERQIRALVLALPSGTVSAEALWTLHDRARYLWMLKDGHFLLRDRDGIEEGDASLNLKPFLRFPGPLLWMEMDPSQQYLVTNSREPVEAAKKPGDVGSPAGAQATMTVDGDGSSAANTTAPEMVVRILRRDSGKVMLVSRTRSSVHLPINTDGYLESLRGNGEQWLLNLNYFSGGSSIMGQVSSTCPPNYDFISKRELLVTACDGTGGRRLLALGTDGRRMWEDISSPQAVWPLLVMAPDGSRLVRETLSVNHTVNAFSPLDPDDIKGQLVRVFDASSGKVVLDAAATPAFDAGGNVAVSPSGRRLAVINAGAIEVFDMPPAATAADQSQSHPAH